MKQRPLFAGIVYGLLLLIATPISAWLYCSYSSSSDYLLNAVMVVFSATIWLLLIAVIRCLFRIKQYVQQIDSGQLPGMCDRCIRICNVSAAIIIFFFGASLAWTAFIIFALYFPHQILSSLPFNWWQLLLYVAIAANLAFHLFAKNAAKRIGRSRSLGFQ